MPCNSVTLFRISGLAVDWYLYNATSDYKVVTFVVFPGVAANWSPQLDIFVSKGILAADWSVNLLYMQKCV